jgi:hypothetical protein
MNPKIEQIWIESELVGPIMGGVAIIDDNSDILVTFTDGTVYSATFFTYENINTLRQKNKSTGELLNGTYLFASNMVIVERIDRETIERIIDHMLDTDSFYYMFAKHQN